MSIQRICLSCHTSFSTFPCRRGMYCSPQCAGIAKRQSVWERLLAGTDFTSHPDHWLWTKGHTEDGYGVIGSNIKQVRVQERVHRLSYQFFIGPIPSDKQINHCCHIPACWNPDHLYAGTQKENLRDMKLANRQNYARGEKHGAAKLTEEKVRFIHRLFEYLSCQQIAEQLDIPASTIAEITRGTRWKHIHDAIHNQGGNDS